MTDTEASSMIPDIRLEPFSSSTTAEEDNSAQNDNMQQSSSSSPSSSSPDARFSCNICFDAVTEPVVTQCGHLYCWPCLYRWMAPGMKPQERTSLGMSPRAMPLAPLDESRRVCPVCKSPCSVPNVVPIYVDNHNSSSGNGNSNNNNHNNMPEPPDRRRETGRNNSTGMDGDQIERERGDTRHSSETSSPRSNTIYNQVPIEDHSEGNMGLDIDGDDDLDEPSHVLPAREMAATTDVDGDGASEGMRRRRTTNSSANTTAALEQEHTTSSSSPAPRRPVPVRETPSNASSTAVVQRSPTPPRNSHHPHAARASLSYGLVLAMHQTLLNATSGGQGNNNNNNNNSRNHNNNNADAGEAIPSLHYPERTTRSQSPISNNDRTTDPSMIMMDTDPASTEFLSRLLLGLSLFVLFCLLAF